MCGMSSPCFAPLTFQFHDKGGLKGLTKLSLVASPWHGLLRFNPDVSPCSGPHWVKTCCCSFLTAEEMLKGEFTLARLTVRLALRRKSINVFRYVKGRSYLVHLQNPIECCEL
jgi:hypothetical protein